MVVGAIDRSRLAVIGGRGLGGSFVDDMEMHMDDAAFTSGESSDVGPAGPVEEGPYDWYTRGLRLLKSGSAGAAEQLLARAAKAEPTSCSALEALGRAQFEARHYARAKATFARIIEADPTDDYGQFALGLSAARIGEVRTAVEHLALAAALRPGVAHYERELKAARARLGIPPPPAQPHTPDDPAMPDDVR